MRNFKTHLIMKTNKYKHREVFMKRILLILALVGSTFNSFAQTEDELKAVKGSKNDSIAAIQD